MCCCSDCCDQPPTGLSALVVTVTTLIFLLYLDCMFFVIHAWRWWSTLFGWVNIVLLNLLLFGVAVAYKRAITTEPGYAPRDYVPPHSTAELLEKVKKEEESARASSRRSRSERYERERDPEAPRYCTKCNAFKPPRAQHCRDCNRCVLQLDHHCPWINNCVGYRNHRYFIQFLVYATLGMTYAAVLLIARLIDFFRHDAPQGKPLSAAELGTMLALLFGAVIDLMVLLGVFSLFCYQAELVSANTTSLESSRRQFEMQRHADNQLGGRYVWPYDLGCFANWQELMGATWREWLLPCVQTSRDRHGDEAGTRFKTNRRRGGDFTRV